MSHVLVEWAMSGDNVLNPPQLEAVSTKNLIARDGVEEGKQVLLKYKGTLWVGSIISVHDKKKLAEDRLSAACRQKEARNPEDGRVQRLRQKKDLGPDFAVGDEVLERGNSDDSTRKSQKRKRDKVEETGYKQDDCEEGHNGIKSSVKKRKETTQSKNCRQLKIVAAKTKEISDLVIGDSSDSSVSDEESITSENLEDSGIIVDDRLIESNFAKCSNKDCMEEKSHMEHEIDCLRKQLRHFLNKQRVDSHVASQELKFGKVPRDLAVDRKWEEIGNGVWVCPLKLRAALKRAKTRSAFARLLLMFFYTKEELKGKRLKELDQEIIHAVSEYSLLVKIQVSGNRKETKATVMQSLRMKMNNLLQEEEQARRRKLKKLQATEAAASTEKSAS